MASTKPGTPNEILAPPQSEIVELMSSLSPLCTEDIDAAPHGDRLGHFHS
jgi:hypothetical protein